MSHHQIGDERLAKKNDLTRSIVLQYLNFVYSLVIFNVIDTMSMFTKLV